MMKLMILTSPEEVQKVENLLEEKMIKVMTSGVLTQFHPGHINILTRAKQQGEYLIVGIQDDELLKIQRKISYT